MPARLFSLLVLFALAADARAADLNLITSVEVKDDGGAVVLSVKSTKQPSFTTFSMADPPRFVIDFSESRFQGVPEELPVANGTIQVVKNLSYGSDASAIARVMVAFTSDVDPPSVEETPGGLVVRIAKPGGAGAAVAGAEPAAPAGAAEAAGDADAQVKAAAEADAQAQAAAEAQARAEVEAKAQAEAEAEARRQAEVKVTAEAEEKARAEAEAKAAEATAEEKARAEAEAKAADATAEQVAAQAREQEQAEARTRAEAEEKARAEAEATASEATANAEAEARAKAEQLAAQAREQEQEARSRAEAEASRRAEEERQRQDAIAGAHDSAETPMAAAPTAAAPTDRLEPEAPSVRLREVGFQQLPGASRVFVRTSGTPRFHVQDAGESSIRIELENTRVDRSNDLRFLDTSFFSSAVAMVTPRREGASYVLEVKLRQRVPYQQKVEGDMLAFDFERPAMAAAAPPVDPGLSEPASADEAVEAGAETAP